MKITEMSRTRLKRLLRAFRGRERVLVLTHDYPDPDSMASAVAIKRLVERRLSIEVEIGFGGIVGRAENRAMVKAVKCPIRPIAELDLSTYQGSPSSTPSRGRGTTRCPRLSKCSHDCNRTAHKAASSTSTGPTMQRDCARSRIPFRTSRFGGPCNGRASGL